MKKEYADKILREMEKGYDDIAGKFSQTRRYFWRELEFIGEYVEEGDKILDFGCGNGRLLNLIIGKNPIYYGVDVSENLINIADKKYQGRQNIHFQKIASGQVSLPFKSNYFKVVYAIAVFHHIPDKNNRLKMARELFRVLKPSGYLIVTVWNLWQKKYFRFILKNWSDKLFGRSKLDWNDCYINFSDNDKKNVFKRYHHAFTKKELAKIFQKAGFVIEEKEISNGGNIIVIAKKKKALSG